MISLDDMRIFAKVAAVSSFTVAAAELAMPKQTVSRRVAELEAALSVRLLHRTTRRVALTEAGRAYAAQCAEMVRLAEAANDSVVGGADAMPRGTLRLTADPVFGEAFLGPVLTDYLQAHPSVTVDVLLTRRRVDLIEEGFDVAFRIGSVDSAYLGGRCFGPARIVYAASPQYVSRRGLPRRPNQLRDHDCVKVSSDETPVRWPIRGRRGLEWIAIEGRVRCNSLALARQLVIAGMGIGMFPQFYCKDAMDEGRLCAVLTESVPDVGSIYLVYPSSRYLSEKVRAFADIAVGHFGTHAPWSI